MQPEAIVASGLTRATRVVAAAAPLRRALFLAFGCSSLASGCARARDSAAPDDARAFVERRYTEHFAGGQGFSVPSLRARRSWFTPRLYQLMLSDMDSPSGEIGYIDHDPFTNAQDDAARFSVGSARQSHDTVLVDVDIAFDSTIAGGQVRARVTLAVVRARNSWEIANFLTANGDLASELARAAERYRLDLDNDGVLDDLVLRATPHPDGPGAFNRLDVVLSTSGPHSVHGLWDPPGAETVAGSDNVVASKAMIVGRSLRAGTLIFLFGEDVSCCLQSVEVYRVSPAGIDKYFERREFAILKPVRQSRQEVAVLEGVEGMSETVGSSAPDAASATTYDPVVVVRLEEQARIDTAASARATIAALGGFAGIGPRADIRAITRRDGERYLWDELRHRRLPAPNDRQ